MVVVFFTKTAKINAKILQIYIMQLLAGISVKLINRLQSVVNAADRTIVGLHRQDHISQTLGDLHWLRMAERIDFKFTVTFYRCLSARLGSNLPVT